MAILQHGLIIVHTGKQYQTKSQVFGSPCHRQAWCLESPSLNIITDGYWTRTRHTLFRTLWNSQEIVSCLLIAQPNYMFVVFLKPSEEETVALTLKQEEIKSCVLVI